MLTAQMESPTVMGVLSGMERADQGYSRGAGSHLGAEECAGNKYGSYCFELQALKNTFPLPQNKTKGILFNGPAPLLLAAGLRVEAYKIDDAVQALGINDRLQLARATSRMREESMPR